MKVKLLAKSSQRKESERYKITHKFHSVNIYGFSVLSGLLCGGVCVYVCVGVCALCVAGGNVCFSLFFHLLFSLPPLLCAWRAKAFLCSSWAKKPIKTIYFPFANSPRRECPEAALPSEVLEMVFKKGLLSKQLKLFPHRAK
jgi:hypothetical protein